MSSTVAWMAGNDALLNSQAAAFRTTDSLRRNTRTDDTVTDECAAVNRWLLVFGDQVACLHLHTAGALLLIKRPTQYNCMRFFLLVDFFFMVTAVSKFAPLHKFETKVNKQQVMASQLGSRGEDQWLGLFTVT